MISEENQVMTEKELLECGIKKLDDALSFIMEMENAAGQVLAHFIHAAVTMGEKIIDAYNAEANGVDAQ